MIQMMKWTDDRFILHMMLTEGDVGYELELMAEANNLPYGKVFFEKPVKPNEIIGFISHYDIGLFILPKIVFNYEHALPNKFFDFIGAGLAVAIGPSPNMAKIVNEFNNGWIASDFEPQTMAHLLNNLTREEIYRKKQASLELRKTLNAESEMSKMVDLVRKIAKV
jgi:hypothetical protein